MDVEPDNRLAARKTGHGGGGNNRCVRNAKGASPRVRRESIPDEGPSALSAEVARSCIPSDYSSIWRRNWPRRALDRGAHVARWIAMAQKGLPPVFFLFEKPFPILSILYEV